uniref:ANK_REP_REGION domain-containing protein n=1 Tax=Macrostomum lignano TaxID=282301 RepID=A0A1I8J9C7_9PLAT
MGEVARILKKIIKLAIDFSEDITELEELLQNKPNYEYLSSVELTEFSKYYWPVWKVENREVCGVLLRYRFSQTKEDIKVAIHLADLSSRGHIEALKKVVTKQSCLLRDLEGRTPLMWAAMGCWKPTERHLECAQLLLNRGSDPLAADLRGDTALHFAAASGNLPVIELLIRAKADAQAANLQGFTALDTAQAHDRVEASALLHCLTASQTDNVSRHTVDKRGSSQPKLVKTPSATAEPVASSAKTSSENRKLLHQLASAVINGQLDEVKRIASPNLIEERLDDDSKTVLMLVADSDQWHSASYSNCVEHILNLGANPETKDVNGDTPVHLAAQQNNIKLLTLFPYSVKFLKNNTGQTPLMVAVLNCSWRCCKHLLHLFRQIRYRQDKEELLHLKDNDARSALDYARLSGRADLAKYIETELNLTVSDTYPCISGLTEEQESAQTKLFSLVQKGDPDGELKQLADHTNCDLPNALGQTVFMRAVWSRRCSQENLKFLANYADSSCTDVFGSSCLHWAARYDREASIKLLVKAGASVNSPDQAGKTPLMCASENGKRRAVELLLSFGADRNLTDCEGRTAARWAEMKNDDEIAALLRKLPGDTVEKPEQTVASSAQPTGSQLVQVVPSVTADISQTDDAGSNKKPPVVDSFFRGSNFVRQPQNQISRLIRHTKYDRNAESYVSDIFNGVPENWRDSLRNVISKDFEDVENFLEQVTDSKERENCILVLAEKASELNMWNMTARLVKMIDDAKLRNEFFTKFAELAASQDYSVEALLLANCTRNSHIRDKCLVTSAEAAAKQNYWDTARSLISKIKDHDSRDSCYSKTVNLALAERSISLQQWSVAISLVGKIEDSSTKSQTAAKAFELAVVQNRQSLFNFLLECVSQQPLKDQCRLNASIALIGRGDWKLGRKLLEPIRDRNSLDQRLLEAMESILRLNRLDRVEYFFEKNY